MPDIIVIGGPNGAGKTTAAKVLLPKELALLEFVNADNIAAGLSPYNPEGVAIAAGRIMLDRMRELVAQKTSFAIETTCAGRGHARFLQDCQRQGWRVTLIYIWLDDPNLAVQRVAQRVREGGHHIPTDVIHRRYWAGLRNMLDLYLPLADTASIYDNTNGDAVPVVAKSPDDLFEIRDAPRWEKLKGSLA